MSLSPLVPRGLHGCLVVRLSRSKSTSDSYLWFYHEFLHFIIIIHFSEREDHLLIPHLYQLTMNTLPNLIWWCPSGPYHRPPSRPCWGPWTRGHNRWSTRSYSPGSPPRTKTFPTPRSSRRLVSRLILRIAASGRLDPKSARWGLEDSDTWVQQKTIHVSADSSQWGLPIAIPTGGHKVGLGGGSLDRYR